MRENGGEYVSVPSVRRLPLYLGFLKEFKRGRFEYVSGTQIAEHFNLQSIQIRKDLAVTKVKGKPKMGYKVDELIQAIELFLGWDNIADAFLVGAGNLGMALLGYERFDELGLNIVATFDSDPAKVGEVFYGREVLPVEKLGNLIERMHVKVAILTTPAASAQALADLMVGSGVRGIWNFTQVVLKTPPGVIVENVRLSSSLSVLTSKLKEMLDFERPKIELE